MALDTITLTDFRNHASTRLSGAKRFNLLLGDNGAGKTNILEAVSLLAPGRGLRRNPLNEMARANGAGGFAISADLNDGQNGDPVRLATGVRPDRPTRRLVHINGAEKPALVLGEWVSISWLTPAMDGLFMASAGDRRRFLDRLVLAIDPLHAKRASRFENALRERNRLLSEDRMPDPQWLDGIEAQMAEASAALVERREHVIAQLSAALGELPDEPFARPTLSLLADRPAHAEELADLWRRSRQSDFAANRTLKGPHRDDLSVVMTSKQMPAAACSTGEQKAMLIAITLAHTEMASGSRPKVLLLDEVAAHLDPIRRRTLFERLADSGTQVWITGTEQAPFAELSGETARWTVANGAVEAA